MCYTHVKSCENTVTLHMCSLKSCAKKNPKDLRQINAITQCGSECVGIARSLILQLIQGADFTSNCVKACTCLLSVYSQMTGQKGEFAIQAKNVISTDCSFTFHDTTPE